MDNIQVNTIFARDNSLGRFVISEIKRPYSTSYVCEVVLSEAVTEKGIKASLFHTAFTKAQAEEYMQSEILRIKRALRT